MTSIVEERPMTPGEQRLLAFVASRLESNPLFDMWLRFEDVFADRAIDRLDISDEDAEGQAKEMDGVGPAGAAFAYLLRRIPARRRLRGLFFKVSAIWDASGSREPLGLPEIDERYAKIKGDA